MNILFITNFVRILYDIWFRRYLYIGTLYRVSVFGYFPLSNITI